VRGRRGDRLDGLSGLSDSGWSTERAGLARPPQSSEGACGHRGQNLTVDTPLATAQGHPDPSPGQCWCCGSIYDPGRMVHLGNHPEGARCLACAGWAAKEAWEMEDRDRTDVLATVRDRFRNLRRRVIDRNWHRPPVLGRPLRWLGRHLP